MTNEELIISYREGNKRALDELVAANQGIINKIANKYYGINKKLEFEDLTQAGNVGLMKAVNRYDPNLENAAKFITYAVFWIDRYINIEVNGRSSRDVENAKLNNSCTSLNQFVNDDVGVELIDTIESDSDDIALIEDRMYYDEMRSNLETAMMKSNSLEEREVLKFKYGWNGNPMTLKEISDIITISEEKTRQCYNRALRRLRNNMDLRKYWVKIYMEEYAAYNYSTYRYVEKKIDLLG
ncbi:sigma-70 family RNA polymerase sigma factor [Clostridium cadaveris]|uniref:sigma-70 family RNA polymerase sigma factor n=1 Tax=Clostridium cadaveris TaxID=1529 RepID=UPI003991F9E9